MTIANRQKYSQIRRHNKGTLMNIIKTKTKYTKIPFLSLLNIAKMLKKCLDCTIFWQVKTLRKKNRSAKSKERKI